MSSGRHTDLAASPGANAVRQADRPAGVGPQGKVRVAQEIDRAVLALARRRRPPSVRSGAGLLVHDDVEDAYGTWDDARALSERGAILWLRWCRSPGYGRVIVLTQRYE